MTTIDADGQGDIPSVPPPTYAQVAASKPKAAAQRQSSQPSSNDSSAPAQPAPAPSSYVQTYTNSLPQPAPSSPPPRTYGPTPLPSSHQDTSAILPYYDARSPWAMQEAASRAKWRFLGGLFWACVIWLAVGSLIGGVVGDAGRRSGRSWAAE